MFFEGLSRVGVVCCFPEVVLDEVVARYGRHLEEAAKNLQKATRVWEQLADEPAFKVPTAADLTGRVEQYSRFLTKQMAERAIELLPYPDVGHKLLVERAINRRKPFGESGSGYRDALIWASIVAMDPTEPSVAFVTNNHKDFGTTPDVHPDLAADLKVGATIELYNSLEQFNAARIVPHLEHLESVLRDLQEERHAKFSLKGWIDRELKDVLNKSDDACHFVGLEPDHGHVWISDIKEQKRIIVDDVRLLPSGDLVVLANADLALNVAVSADWEDCDRHRDVREFFNGDCAGNPTAWVEEEGNVAFTLTLKGPNLEVDWCDLDEIRGQYVVEINPHPRRND